MRLKTGKPGSYFLQVSMFVENSKPKTLGDDWISPLAKSKPSGIEISARLSKSPRDFPAPSFVLPYISISQNL